VSGSGGPNFVKVDERIKDTAASCIRSAHLFGSRTRAVIELLGGCKCLKLVILRFDLLRKQCGDECSVASTGRCNELIGQVNRPSERDRPGK